MKLAPIHRRTVSPQVVALLIALGIALWLAPTRDARAANPDALWQIVHDRCEPNARARLGPAPCARVDARGGFAILKDLRGVAQFLLIPTARLSGIEDPALRDPRALPYWQDAWNARRVVDARLPRPLGPTEVSLAVNSAYGRSQNQLHFHIDCIDPAVRAALRRHGPAIGARWVALPEPLAGHAYRVRRVARLSGPDGDPFRLVAAGLPDAADAMDRESILVTGAPSAGRSPAFFVLETRADAGTGNRGSAEELQDHACSIAGPRAGTRAGAGAGERPATR